MSQAKSIFITGAASGIGRETAKLFAAQGWLVGAVDLDEGGLQSLQAEIGLKNCVHAVMDVTDPHGFQATVDAFAEKTGGRMDVLFNNAGILRMGPNESIPLEQQHLTVNVNVNGLLTGVQCSLGYLKRTPGARIISMCSTSSVYGLPELAVYSASKHAVAALTEALDLELEQYGIAVSDIMAPYVSTPMVTAAKTQAHSVHATGVNLSPEQIAALVWKAAHGKKLHWKIHYLTRVMFGAFWAFPFLRRPMTKMLCLTPRK
jgi:NAD(P)-dependent dehydrogenase (short-subunit alcohol dehydrogenase family)